MKTKKKLDSNIVFPIKKIVVALLFFSILFTFIYLSVFAENGLLHMIRLESEYYELEASNKRIIAENEKISYEISLLLDEPGYIEEIARTELGFVKRGEIIYHNSDG